MDTYSASEIELRTLFAYDFRLYAKECLSIRDKKGKIVPLELNSAQNKVDEIFEKQAKTKKPLRFIVLKARQEGISTYFEGRIYHRTTYSSYRKAMIVGHEAEASTNLFNMFKTYHELCPAHFKASTEHSNEKKLSFDVIKSEIKVATAESREKLGRSSTVQDLHCTEVAFWADAENSMLALLQVVPEEPNTMVVVESTANGFGGWFYDTWQKAVSGENDFTPIFLAWFELTEYTRDFMSEIERDNFTRTLSNYEKELISKYNLTHEQINWHRYTLINKCNNDIDKMKQEYPSTPEEAFIVSGRPVFDQNICFANLNNSKEPIRKGNLVYRQIDTKGNKKVEFVEDAKGYLSIYADFKINDTEHNKFAIGCDVAEGLAQGDYSVISIFDRVQKKVIAEWHGHIAPNLLSIEQKKIQEWLNDECYTCTEFNNHGLTVIVKSYELGVKQYYRQDWQKGYEDSVDNMQLGFKTTAGTKPIMINNLDQAIRDREFTDYCADFWREAMTFVRNERGQMQAQDKDKDPSIKCFDDRVIARGLMWICNLWMPGYYKDQEKEHPSWYYEDFERDLEGAAPSVMSI